MIALKFSNKSYNCVTLHGDKYTHQGTMSGGAQTQNQRILADIVRAKE